MLYQASLNKYSTGNIGVELKIENGGGVLSFGKYVKYVHVNHWKIPLRPSHSNSEEEDYSIYTYHIFEGRFSFFRCCSF